MTSSIARMNCFLHGIEDFQIVRGDTLAEPKLVEGDRLKRFDVVLANPPYSIKQWDRDAFASDPWGRNLYGTPPQGRADYAFWQHILQSLNSKTGRCAILFPHGVLFRQEEAEMRRKLIEADLIECVLGLGPNLFYNSPMEACVVICRINKPKAHRGRILFINAVNEVTRERAQSFLTDDHIERIVDAYQRFKDEHGLARVVPLAEIRANSGNLSIPMYIASGEPANGGSAVDKGSDFGDSISGWIDSSHEVRSGLAKILGKTFKPLVASSPKVRAEVPNWLKRSEWKRMPFGQFAENINERVEPADAAEEIYVGLDDLDSGCLHLRRWGKGSDVIGTKLRFCKGDIIFGRRRAYQRKLIVADFDGICSAHALVVRAKPEVALPDFLPFLMMSDKFMNRAVEISVGSLSPTINWTTLKLEEFDLPPIDQQRRIAEILRRVDESVEASTVQFEAASALKRVAMDQSTAQSGPSPAFRPIGEVASFQYGLSCPLNETGEYPVLRMMNFDEEVVVANDLKYVDMSRDLAKGFMLEKGDILFNRTNSAELVGKVGLFRLTGSYLFASYLVRVKADQKVLLPEFLNFYLNSDIGQKAIRAYATPGVSQSNISAGSLKKLLVPVPSLPEQEIAIRNLSNVATTKKAVKLKIECERALLNKLVDYLMG